MSYEADLRAHYREVGKRLNPRPIPIVHEEKIEPIHVVHIPSPEPSPPPLINPVVKAKIPYVARFVAEHYKISLDAMMSHTRKAPITLIRHIAMWISCRCEGQGLAKVGRFFRRDHTSVLHARNRIQGMMEKDPQFASEVWGIVIKLSEHKTSVIIPAWMSKNGGLNGLAD